LCDFLKSEPFSETLRKQKQNEQIFHYLSQFRSKNYCLTLIKKGGTVRKRIIPTTQNKRLKVF